MFRLDHSQCSDKILTAIAENKIQFDAMDATKGLMTFEASYANFKEGLGDFNPDCNRFRRGLYLQVILCSRLFILLQVKSLFLHSGLIVLIP